MVTSRYAIYSLKRWLDLQSIFITVIIDRFLVLDYDDELASYHKTRFDSGNFGGKLN